jgi:phospholipase/carboxylesterase
MTIEWGAPLDSARVAVIAVHGRNQDAAFMKSLTDRMRLDDVAFVAPEATGGSWYPLSFLEPIEANQPQLDDALGVLDEQIERLANRGFDPSRLVLLGFSQGACLVSQHALTRAGKYQRAIAFTGGYVGVAAPALGEGAESPGLTVLLATIEHDSWVPAQRVLDTAEEFRRRGTRVLTRVDPGLEHIVTWEALDEAALLLRAD